ncbi:MAG TPA: hypothetical protein VEU76_09280 [Candidatus Udaeobacter sp.]|nr:hypothetical protein [Candidatus Udaeobacter sp.]
MAGVAAVLIAATIAAVLLASRMHSSSGSSHAPSPTPAGPDVLAGMPFNCLGGAGLGAGPYATVSQVSRLSAAAGHGYDRLTIVFSVAVPSQTSLSSQSGATFTQAGGGQPVTLEGAYGAILTLHPADAHTAFRGQTDLKPHLPAILELRLVQDSDGVVGWAVGLSRSPCYRLAYLTDPLRVVVDFQTG